jgi:hypothetical protein
LKPGVNQVESFQDFTTTGSKFKLEVLFNLIIFIVFKSSVSALRRMVSFVFQTFVVDAPFFPFSFLSPG